MRIVFITLIIALSIILVIFGAQNNNPVNVQFLTFQSGATSLSLVIVLSAVAGALLVALWSMYDSIRRGMRFRRVNKERGELEKRVALLEQELSTLRGTAPTQAIEAGAKSNS